MSRAGTVEPVYVLRLPRQARDDSDKKKRRNPRGNVRTVALIGAAGIGGLGLFLAAKEGILGPLQPYFHKLNPALFPAGPRSQPRSQPGQTQPAPGKTPSKQPGLPGPVAPPPVETVPVYTTDVFLDAWGTPGFAWNPETREVFTASEGWLVGHGSTPEEAAAAAAAWWASNVGNPTYTVPVPARPQPTSPDNNVWFDPFAPSNIPWDAPVDRTIPWLDPGFNDPNYYDQWGYGAQA